MTLIKGWGIIWEFIFWESSEMITDSFDNKTEEILKPWKKEDAKKVDACILTFSNEILQYVLEAYDCTKIGDIYSSNGAKPVYGFTYKDKEFAIYMSFVGAPGCVGDIEDSMSVIKTDKYIECGFEVKKIDAKNIRSITGRIIPSFSWKEEQFLRNGFGYIAEM